MGVLLRLGNAGEGGRDMPLTACIFCAIIEGRAEAYRVYEDDDVLVILDKYPVSFGHLLVLSKSHYESLRDAPPKIAAKVMAVASALVRIYRDRIGAPGVKVVANSGRPAGQEIFHLHVHVIPFWPGERRVPRQVLRSDEASKIVSMLRKYISLVEEYLAEAGLG